MISGIITLYPKFGNETFKDLKTKEEFRNIPCSTEEGFEIYITIKEHIYQKYSQSFVENAWGNENKFLAWVNVRSLSEATKSSKLSNLYLKVDFIEPIEEYPEIDENINLFSVNAHLTKTNKETEHNKFFRIAANKSILNKNEKMNKSVTYCYVKTSLDAKFENKDLMQGSAKLIHHDGELMLEALNLIQYTACKEITQKYIKGNELLPV